MIVGAGQVSHRREPDGGAVEPVALAVRALRAAGRDSGAGETLLRHAESVRCVAITSWPYRDAAALVAADLGIDPRETVQPTHSAATGGRGWSTRRRRRSRTGIWTSRSSAARSPWPR